MSRLALALVMLGTAALPKPSAPPQDLDAHLGACHNSFGGTAFALCHRAAPRDRLTMRLTGGARQANGKTGYTTEYGEVQALLTAGRPFAAGEGIVVTGTIRPGGDVAVAFGDRQFRGSAVWHLRRGAKLLRVTVPRGAKTARLELDGRAVSPSFRIAPGARLHSSELSARFTDDRNGFLHSIGGGDVCSYLDEAVARQLTKAQCASFGAKLANELLSIPPTSALSVAFWDYNGAILASTTRRHPSPTGDGRELWQLEHGRFRLRVS